MTDTLADLERRLAALEDIAAIKDLKSRYFRALDLRRPDDVLECFDPDHAVIAYEGFPVLESREAFVDVFRTMGCQPGIFDMHHGCNPQITLTGSDTATGKWGLYFNSIILATRMIIQLGCEYEDEYTRKNGRWWISRTATRKTSTLIETIDAAGNPKVLTLGESEAAYGELPT